MEKEQFGSLLRQYRNRAGQTQEELARSLELDASTISRLESGERSPPRDPQVYRRLQEVLGLSDEELEILMLRAAPVLPHRWNLEDDLRKLPGGQPILEAAFHIRNADITDEEKELLGRAVGNAVQYWILQRGVKA